MYLEATARYSVSTIVDPYYVDTPRDMGVTYPGRGVHGDAESALCVKSDASNYRIERHMRDKVPSTSMGGCGAHAER